MDIVTDGWIINKEPSFIFFFQKTYGFVKRAQEETLIVIYLSHLNATI